MKKINLSAALIGVGIALTSCGGGGGSSGNGVSSSGYYQLTVQAMPTGIVYSFDPATMSVPSDSWAFNVSFYSSSSAPSSGGVITSASLCVNEQGLSVNCMPVVVSNPVISNTSNVSFTGSFDFYKYGLLALETNPFQDLTTASSTAIIPMVVSSNSLITNLNTNSMTIPYTSEIFTSNNLYPNSVVIAFSYTVPASATLLSETILPNSSSTVISKKSIIGSTTYVATGYCIDNGNGGFTTISSDTGIVCSGSINYLNGVISGFSVSQVKNATVSTTYTTTILNSSSTIASSSTASSSTASTILYITTYNITSSSSDMPSASNLNLAISYMYNINNILYSSSVVQGVIPSIASYTNGLYTSTSFVPSGIEVVMQGTTPSGTTSISTTSLLFYSCQQAQCSVNGNVLTATLPVSISSNAMVYAVGNNYTFYAINPNLSVPYHLSQASIPYTFTVNVLLNSGQTMTASYSGNFVIETP